MSADPIKKRMARARASAAGRNLSDLAHSGIADLVRIRQEAGLSQGVMAKRSGVSVITIVRFEHGKHVRIHTAKVIQSAYALVKKAPDLQAFDGSGNLDAAWLRKQTENFLRQNCLGVVEKDKFAHFILSTDRVYEYGRILLLAAGKNID
jgi:transcriptional regulator with XRE-family HTH domain